MRKLKNLWFLFTALLLLGCGSSSMRFEKTPLDLLIQQLSNEQNYSIILYDMDYDEVAKQYMHKYQVVVPNPKLDTVASTITDWLKVPDYLFKEHLNDMGMEIVSKVNGKLNKGTAPAGYNHYVGNERYGHWTNRNGGSFWEFYGKYAFMSSMFHMMAYPVRRSYWNDYHTNYYGYGRAYYGPSYGGRSYYGTNSAYNSSRRTHWNSKSSTFKQRIRSRVSRSSSRRSRSTSRFRSSSYRSRGGGFGK